jgi:hypothetical protein
MEKDGMKSELRHLAWTVILTGVCGGVLAILVSAQTASRALAQKVPPEDARNTHIVTTDTQMPLPAFTDLQSWETRKAFLRNQILVSAGLSPLPEKTPLNPQLFGKIQGHGYTIEKVLLETLPGFYLGGNLYRPPRWRAKASGDPNPHGHWPYGRLENEQINSGPALGISLAR